LGEVHAQCIANVRADLEENRLSKRSMGKKTNCEES
jgi:hypothetical protein